MKTLLLPLLPVLAIWIAATFVQVTWWVRGAGIDRTIYLGHGEFSAGRCRVPEVDFEQKFSCDVLPIESISDICGRLFGSVSLPTIHLDESNAPYGFQLPLWFLVALFVLVHVIVSRRRFMRSS